jgi:hypothetical protein
MMNIFHFRLALVCAALLALAAGMPARVSAQNDNCRCDVMYIKVDPGVLCKLTACVIDPSGNRQCATISPGTTVKLPCIPGATFGFVDCHGNFVPFTPSATGCQLGIGVGPHCCTIDACIDPNDTQCLTIDVRPSILDICPCQ